MCKFNGAYGAVRIRSHSITTIRSDAIGNTLIEKSFSNCLGGEDCVSCMRRGDVKNIIFEYPEFSLLA